MGRKKETKRVLRYVTGLLMFMSGCIVMGIAEIETLSIKDIILTVVGFAISLSGVFQMTKQLK